MSPYRYRRDNYAELRVGLTDHGGLELVILKDGGSRVESIIIPVTDVPEVVAAIVEQARHSS